MAKYEAYITGGVYACMTVEIEADSQAEADAALETRIKSGSIIGLDKWDSDHCVGNVRIVEPAKKVEG